MGFAATGHVHTNLEYVGYHVFMIDLKERIIESKATALNPLKGKPI